MQSFADVVSSVKIQVWELTKDMHYILCNSFTIAIPPAQSKLNCNSVITDAFNECMHILAQFNSLAYDCNDNESIFKI